MERKAEEARPRQPGCPLPFQPVPGTTPTPSRGCGAGEGGRGLCSAVVFHFTFVDPGGKRECPSLSPASALSRRRVWEPGWPSARKRNRALGTCPAASRRASRAGRGCLALALPRPPRARKPETRVEPGSLRCPWPHRRDPLQTLGPAGRVERTSGSGFSKHTFVSTHATGWAQTPRARAHTAQRAADGAPGPPGGGQRQRARSVRT